MFHLIAENVLKTEDPPIFERDHIGHTGSHILRRPSNELRLALKKCLEIIFLKIKIHKCAYTVSVGLYSVYSFFSNTTRTIRKKFRKKVEFKK